MNIQRLEGTWINLGQTLISVAVFFVALFVVMGLANAQRPDTMDMLASLQNFGIYHVLTRRDLVVKIAFTDDNTSLYIYAERERSASLVNGKVVVPIFVGQLVMHTSVLAAAAKSSPISVV